AYRSTSAVLQARQTQAEFEAEVAQLGLTGYASSQWWSRQVNNNVATLEGSITRKDSLTLPMTVTLLWEGNAWKVQSLAQPGAKPVPKLPTAAEAGKLATDTLLDFNAAVKAADFAGFHSRLSDLWKGEITPEKLREVFKAFIDNQIDIAGI